MEEKGTAMPRRQHKYDAFIVGEHDLPDEAFDLQLRDGYVVVHDRTREPMVGHVAVGLRARL